MRQFDELLASRYHQDIDTLIKQAHQAIKGNRQNLCGGEAEIEMKIQQAQEAFRSIQQQLDNDLNEMKYNLCSAGKEQLISEANHTLNGAIGQLVRAAKNNSLSQEISTLLRPVMQVGINQLVDEEVSRLQSKMETLPQTEGHINVAIQLPPEEKEQFSAKYAAIAAGLATLFTGPVGAVITGLLGGLFGRKDNTEEREQQIRQRVTQQVIPETVRQVVDHIESQLREAVAKLSQSIHKALEQERSTYEANLNQLKQSLQQTQDDLQKQQSQYDEWLVQLEELQALSQHS